MDKSSVTNEEAIAIILDNYYNYLKHFNLSEEKIKEEADYFLTVLNGFLITKPYKLELNIKKYIQKLSHQIFEGLMQKPTRKQGHDVARIILNKCFTKEIEPKNEKTILFLQYSRIFEIVILLLHLIVAIVSVTLNLKFGLQVF